ncbi:hypothetical protein H2201_004815 [Coniosporium apollinis]|uniref:Uncharacterized protein n=1 Tax=Coniosporium apollinis TaxID=61459 RepID=A0ABQ9NRV5_9PEZI|nr:hypothetical protein H2201_004815 [Coniosporium apollinis]
MASVHVTRIERRVNDALNPTKKPKTTVSTSAIFKKPLPPRTASKALKPNLKTTVEAKFVSRRNVASESVSKKPGGARKKESEHPLSVAFNESTAAYRTATFDIVKGRLDDAYHALIARLDATSPSSDANPDLAPEGNAPRANTNLQKEHADLIRQLTQPIAEEKLRIMETNRDGTATTQDVVLGAQMADFAKLVEREEGILHDLQGQHERVVSEIVALAVEILGQREAQNLIIGLGLSMSSPLANKKGKTKTVGFSDSESGDPRTSVDALRGEVDAVKERIESIGAEAVAEMEKEVELSKKERKEKRRKLAELLRNE